MASVTDVYIERVSESRLSQIDLANVEFSRVMSDHVLVAEYRHGGWRDAAIRAYGPIALPPNIPGPHVAQAFAKADPYVVNGLVANWRVREWTTVTGDDAAAPVRPSQA